MVHIDRGGVTSVCVCRQASRTGVVRGVSRGDLHVDKWQGAGAGVEYIQYFWGQLSRPDICNQ